LIVKNRKLRKLEILKATEDCKRKVIVTIKIIKKIYLNLMKINLDPCKLILVIFRVILKEFSKGKVQELVYIRWDLLEIATRMIVHSKISAFHIQKV
jgi:hypothetical protein